MKPSDFIKEAANPAQQAAIAIAMKKAGKKPKNETNMKSAEKEPTGPRFTGYFKGKDKPSVGRRLVGGESLTLENLIPGDQIRTQKMGYRGIVESIEFYRPFGEPAVYFRTADNCLLRTPISNVIKIPKGE